MKIFHLGYLLLLDSLDMPDDEFGTRSARLLAQMRDQGMKPRSIWFPARATALSAAGAPCPAPS
jgi:hypothetical protein